MKILNPPVFARGSGPDLCSTKYLVINPGERALVPTGVPLRLTPGIEAQLRPRITMAYEHGVTILTPPALLTQDIRQKSACC
ncbi:hypothetical protein HC928_18290 [bacterium]|nr:hypothetical protein [bacterium]